MRSEAGTASFLSCASYSVASLQTTRIYYTNIHTPYGEAASYFLPPS
jgi:hypothetical protein